MICTSVKSENYREVLLALDKYPFVELRIDDFNFTDTELQSFFASAKVRTISTCRNSIISDSDKFEMLKKCIEFGSNAIDVEIDYKFRDEIIILAKLCTAEVIISEHNFESAPSTESMVSLAEYAFALGADYFKIACKCNDTKECLQMLNLYGNEKISKIFPRKLISLPIGNGWKLARLSTISLGSPFVYVSSDEGAETAPGQIGYHDFHRIIEIIR